MKRIAVMLALFLLAAPAQAEMWSPSLELLTMIEHQVKIPDDPPSKTLPAGRKNSVAKYARYYFAWKTDTTSIIQVTYVRADLFKPAAKPGQFLGRLTLAPGGNGCGVVHFNYDAKTGKIDSLHCNRAN